MSKRYFEFVDAKSNKFWEIWIKGTSVFTRYGKVGVTGQTAEKTAASAAEAQKLHDKLVREKTGKGYVEKGAKGADAQDGKAAVAKGKKAGEKEKKAGEKEKRAAAPSRPIVPVEPVTTLPAGPDGFDGPGFDPALVALLELLRRERADTPRAEALSLVRAEMPAPLRALVMSAAYAQGAPYFDLPTTHAVENWWLESRKFSFPDPENEYYVDGDGVSGLTQLGADYLLSVGVDPGGHVELYAAWSSGDEGFRLCAWDGEFQKALEIGSVTDLLQQALDRVHDKKLGEDLRPKLGKDEREWVELAKQKGAKLNEPVVSPARALSDACADGNLALARELLAKGAKKNPKTLGKGLAAACKQARADDVAAWIELGALKDTTLINEGFIAACAEVEGTPERAARWLALGVPPTVRTGEGRQALSFAAKTGSHAVCSWLLDQGLDIDDHDEDSPGGTPLIAALGAKRLDIARLLLERGANPNLTSYFGDSAGVTAIGGARSNELLRLCIAKGLDVHARNKDGETLLHHAAFSGMKDCFEELLSAGVDPQLTNKEGQTARQIAEEKDHPEIVALVPPPGPEVAERHARDASLRAACEANDPAAFVALLKEGGELSGVRSELDEALASCCGRGDLKRAKAWVAAGADPKRGDDGGPLVAAIRFGKDQIVPWLAPLADPDRPSAAGKTPLMVALSVHSPSLALVLLKHGANPNRTDKHGQNAGIYALELERGAKVLRAMLEKGLDVRYRGHMQRTLLFWAASTGNEEAIDALLEHGAEIDARDVEGHTAIIQAILMDRSRAAERLIERGANLAMHEGWSPLMQAAFNDRADVVDLLLARGADPQEKGHEGKNAIEWAKKAGNKALAKRLAD